MTTVRKPSKSSSSSRKDDLAHLARDLQDQLEADLNAKVLVLNALSCTLGEALARVPDTTEPNRAWKAKFAGAIKLALQTTASRRVTKSHATKPTVTGSSKAPETDSGKKKGKGEKPCPARTQVLVQYGGSTPQMS